MRPLLRTSVMMLLVVCHAGPSWGQRSGSSKPHGPPSARPGGGAPHLHPGPGGGPPRFSQRWRTVLPAPPGDQISTYYPVPANTRFTFGPDDAPPSSGGPSGAQGTFDRRLLRVKNDTDDRLSVSVQYRTTVKDDEWAWFPADPERSAKALEFELEPGESAVVSDGRRKIEASRVRLWARADDESWLRYKTQDLWLVPEADDDGRHVYDASRMGMYTFVFNVEHTPYNTRSPKAGGGPPKKVEKGERRPAPVTPAVGSRAPDQAAAPTERLTSAQKEQLKTHDAEAQKLRAQGKFAEAAAAVEKILAIQRKAFGDSSLEAAYALDYEAAIFEEGRDFDRARKARRESLEIYARVLGDKDWRTTDARVAADRLDKLARFGPADRDLLAAAERLTREVDALHQKGHFRDALPAAVRALELRRKVWGADDPDVAANANDVAVLHQRLGDYAAARREYEQALAVMKKVLGAEHPTTARTLNNLGGLLEDMGDYPQARAYYEEGLAVRRKILGEDLDTATSLNNLGFLLQEMGDYGMARSCFEQALAIRTALLAAQEPGTDAWASVAIDRAQSLYNLGLLFHLQHDHAAARKNYEEALKIRRKVLSPDHADTAWVLNSLGVLCQETRAYAESRTFFEEALSVRKKALGPRHPYTAATLDGLAGLCEATGDYPRAEELLRQALDIRKDLGENHPEYAAGLKNLAELYDCKGEPARAEPLLRASLEIAQRNLRLASAVQSEREQLAMARTLRARLGAYLSVAPRAKAAGEPAYRFVLAWKGTVFARQRRMRDLRHALARGKDPQLAALYDELQTTATKLARVALSVPDPADRDGRERQVEELTQRKERLERELSRRSEDFRKQQTQEQVTPAQVKAALPPDTALVDFLEYPSYRPPADGKGRWSAERRLAAFVVRADSAVEQIDLGPGKPITDAINKWRLYALQRRPADKGQDEVGAELRRLLWAPLEARLKGAKTVLVSPDGVLAQMPLAALPGREPGTYVLDDVALAVVPVAQLLPELTGGSARPGPNDPPADDSLLLVGGVDFGARPGRVEVASAGRRAVTDTRAGVLFKWSALANTRDEVAAVKLTFEEHFPDARPRLLMGRQATESRFRQEAPRHRWVHVATHGFFAPPQLQSAFTFSPAEATGRREGVRSRPDLLGAEGVSGFHPGLLSGLVFAGANNPPAPDEDDGILTALEVAELDLSRVDLAVLSACETGLGKVAGGEGLLGLQRAFQEAGARSVVATLWKVRDKETSQLMARFYENLWEKKLPKLEALREAQLWMLREGPTRSVEREDDDEPAAKKKGRALPYYWAGFVLSGDWR